MTAEEFICNHFGCSRKFLAYNITQKPYEVVRVMEAYAKHREDEIAENKGWWGRATARRNRKIVSLQKQIAELKELLKIANGWREGGFDEVGFQKRIKQALNK